MTFCFFFFNDTATTEIYTLSLHDALPICDAGRRPAHPLRLHPGGLRLRVRPLLHRSEEHTSELQSPCNLVCRLLLEKKNKSAMGKPSAPLSRPNPAEWWQRCEVDPRMEVPWTLSGFFFFNDTATTEIYTLSLHDALPICARCCSYNATAFSAVSVSPFISSEPTTY